MHTCVHKPSVMGSELFLWAACLKLTAMNEDKVEEMLHIKSIKFEILTDPRYENNTTKWLFLL